MKNIFDSPDVFEAYATIDAGYFLMRQIQTEMDNSTKLYPIDKMIMQATGADKELLEAHKKRLAVCLLDIIEAKKIIEADYSKDEEFLFQLIQP